MSRCYGCMMPAVSGVEVCPYCGYVYTSLSKVSYYLSPGTVLKNRYLVGAAIGGAGYYITYLGYDLQENRRVAVKEFYPVNYADRCSYQSSSIYIMPDKMEIFKGGKDAFSKEYEFYRRLSGLPAALTIYDILEENNTIYAVIEPLQGIDLKQYIRSRGERLSFEETMHILSPVLGLLSQLHKQKYVRGNIAPHEIYITEDNKTKLLGFSFFEPISSHGNKCIVLYPSFAPIEEYTRKGKIGAWTDIYALGAVIYYCITVTYPQEAIDRVYEDNLRPPSQLGAVISEKAEKALLKAMSVKPRNRYKTIEQFKKALTIE